MATERKQLGNKRSILDPHLDTVINLRRRGLSWAKVAEELCNMGVATTSPNVWKWFRRRQRQASRVARELRPFDQLSKTGGSGIGDVGSVENPANTADQAAAAVERLTSQKSGDEFKPLPVKRKAPLQPSSLEGGHHPETFSIGDDILK